MTVWWLILSMALVTYLPRYLPMALAGRWVLPHWLASALDFVPIAVLTAIIAQATLYRDNELLLSMSNHHALAALAAFIAAVFSRHLFLTIMVGLISFGLLGIMS